MTHQQIALEHFSNEKDSYADISVSAYCLKASWWGPKALLQTLDPQYRKNLAKKP
jgi:hypothetical protein